MNYRDLNAEGNIHVFLDISIDGIKSGRVIIELFKNHVPKTAENFRALCTGEKGTGGLKVPLHYKNSIFHKAVPECIVQGGDITNHDGTGGESIYGPYFKDESLEILHSEAGLLSMANCGHPHTNNSQFCVTLGQASHLDGAHVVFGRVVKGFNIINSISYQALHPNDMPVPECKIWDCGELQPGQDWAYCDQDFSDVYPPYPEDWEPPLSSPLQVSDIVEVVTDIKDTGNQLLKRGDNIYAYQKYKKCLRYLDWLASQKCCDREQTTAVRTQVRLNAALACLRLRNFRDAICHCNEVPDMETNTKALFRRALAREGLNDHHEALRDLALALQLSPAEPAVLAEVSRINRFLSSYQAAERRWCSRMFRT